MAGSDPVVRARPRVRRGREHARRPRRDGVTMITVKLDDLLYARRMTLTELADRVDLAPANRPILKPGKARAIRFPPLEAICAALQCQPGDLLHFEPDPGAQ